MLESTVFSSMPETARHTNNLISNNNNTFSRQHTAIWALERARKAPRLLTKKKYPERNDGKKIPRKVTMKKKTPER